MRSLRSLQSYATVLNRKRKEDEFDVKGVFVGADGLMIYCTLQKAKELFEGKQCVTGTFHSTLFSDNEKINFIREINQLDLEEEEEDEDQQKNATAYRCNSTAYNPIATAYNTFHFFYEGGDVYGDLFVEGVSVLGLLDCVKEVQTSSLFMNDVDPFSSRQDLYDSVKKIGSTFEDCVQTSASYVVATDASLQRIALTSLTVSDLDPTAYCPPLPFRIMVTQSPSHISISSFLINRDEEVFLNAISVFDREGVEIFSSSINRDQWKVGSAGATYWKDLVETMQETRNMNTRTEYDDSDNDHLFIKANTPSRWFSSIPDSLKGPAERFFENLFLSYSSVDTFHFKDWVDQTVQTVNQFILPTDYESFKQSIVVYKNDEGEDEDDGLAEHIKEWNVPPDQLHPLYIRELVIQCIDPALYILTVCKRPELLTALLGIFSSREEEEEEHLQDFKDPQDSKIKQHFPDIFSNWRDYLQITTVVEERGGVRAQRTSSSSKKPDASQIVKCDDQTILRFELLFL